MLLLPLRLHASAKLPAAKLLVAVLFETPAYLPSKILLCPDLKLLPAW